MVRNKKFSIPLAIAVLILLASFFVKVQHWSIGAMMEKVSLTAIGLIYMLRFYKKKNKNILDIIKLVLISSYALVSILMSFQFDGLYYLQRFVMLVAIAWTILEIVGFAKNKYNKLNAVLYVGTVILMIEIAFRIMRWPGSSILHILSLTLIITGLFIDYSKQYKGKVHNTTYASLLDETAQDDSSRND